MRLSKLLNGKIGNRTILFSKTVSNRHLTQRLGVSKSEKVRMGVGRKVITQFTSGLVKMSS